MKATILISLKRLFRRVNTEIILFMTKMINIGGVDYAENDERITKDYFNSGRYLLIVDAIPIVTEMTVQPNVGYQGNSQVVYTDRRTFDRKLADGIILKYKTRFGTIHISHAVNILGQGRIYQERGIYVDDATRAGANPRKFRSFDNTARLFTDINNPLIPEQDQKALIKRNFDYGVDSPTFNQFEGLDYTFGVEIETSAGRLDPEDVKGLNLKCEFDGSLRETPDQRKEDVLGGEYITGVLKGDAGMFQLQKIANKIAEKCDINEKCGVHVHIGNIRLNKESLIYMYKLGEMLQNEVYEMLPASRRKNVYCRKIKDLSLDMDALNNVKTTLGHKILIDEYYNKIFKEVSHGKVEADRQHNKTSNHPMGSKCGYDKATQRYCWLNFVTAMFNTKGNPNAMTLEFRSHSATVNYVKIRNWVKICMAFVAFAENHKLSIKRGYWLDKNKIEHEINLDTIVKAIYPRSYKTLSNYIAKRKNQFRYDKGDIEKLEYQNDKEGIKFLTLKEDITCA